MSPSSPSTVQAKPFVTRLVLAFQEQFQPRHNSNPLLLCYHQAEPESNSSQIPVVKEYT